MQIGHRKETGKVTFRVLSLRRTKWTNIGWVHFLYKRMELCYWLVRGNVKNNRINRLNEMCWLTPKGSWLRVPIWKKFFLFESFAAFRASLHEVFGEGCRLGICCLEWLGRLKCLATALHAVLSPLSMSRRCSWNRSPSGLPGELKWSVIFMDCWGPDIFAALRMRKTCYLFELHFRLKSYLPFYRVWMELVAAAKRFYQDRDHFELI